MKTLIMAISIGIAGMVAYFVNSALPKLEPSDEPAFADATGPTQATGPSIDWSQGGAALFKANCARCHNPKLEKGLTGPALYRVQERIPGGDWIYRWIANSSQLIKEGDPYAVKIYAENNKAQMDPFPNLTKEEIDLIMGFIATYEPGMR